MFAVPYRQCSSSIAGLASTRRTLTKAFLSTSNSTTSRGPASSPNPLQPTMFDFDNTSQTPRPFPYPVEDIPPSGRGFPKSLYRPAPILRSPLRYRLHCRSSRNNTVVQVTEPNGRSIGWFSGGSLKFKGANRASYEAGYQCAVAAFEVINEVVREKGDVQLELYFKGFGQGREAMKIALLAVEGTEIRKLVSLIQDRTPIKIGGTRAPKARRL